MFIVSSFRAIVTTALVAFILGWLTGAGAFVQKAHAETISPGDLMYTDFFLWPDWRENLALYDCTAKLWYFLENPPLVDLQEPPVLLEPPVNIVPVPPIVPVATPEPSTWALLLLGLGAILWKRGHMLPFGKAVLVTGAMWGSLGLCRANTLDCNMVTPSHDRVQWSFTLTPTGATQETAYSLNGVFLPVAKTGRWSLVDTSKRAGAMSILHSFDDPSYDIIAVGSAPAVWTAALIHLGSVRATGVCIGTETPS